MQVIILLSVCGLAFAKPSVILTPSVSSQYHSQDEFGQYSYGYANGHSSKAELKTFDGITKGGYSYIDAEGKLQSVEYTADDINGFRVSATNLPVAPAAAPIIEVTSKHLEPVQDTPEVAEAKAKHLAEIEKAKNNLKSHNEDSIHIEAPTNINLPSTTFIHNLPSAAVAQFSSVRVSTPGIVYSYGVPVHYPAPIATYPAPIAVPIAETRDISPITKIQLPVAPNETPEVSKARAEHLAEVEKLKKLNKADN